MVRSECWIGSVDVLKDVDEIVDVIFFVGLGVALAVYFKLSATFTVITGKAKPEAATLCAV